MPTSIQVVSGTVAPIPTDVWAGNGNTNDTAATCAGYAAGTIPYTTGMVGQAFQFTGKGEVTVPDNQTLDSSSFTIGGWYDLTQTGPSTWPASTTATITAGTETNGSDQLVFQLNASRNSATTLNGTTALATDQWYYIAATYNGSNVALYVNGQLAAQGTLAGGYTPSETPYASMVIGGASWTTAYAQADIEQFAFYSSALTLNQITATYDATLSLSQPAYEGYGIFNVASGVTVSITGLTLGDGDAVDGGAINNSGTVTITGSQLRPGLGPGCTLPGSSRQRLRRRDLQRHRRHPGGDRQLLHQRCRPRRRGRGQRQHGRHRRQRLRRRDLQRRGRPAGSGRRHLLRRLRHRRQRR